MTNHVSIKRWWIPAVLMIVLANAVALGRYYDNQRVVTQSVGLTVDELRLRYSGSNWTDQQVALHVWTEAGTSPCENCADFSPSADWLARVADWQCDGRDKKLPQWAWVGVDKAFADARQLRRKSEPDERFGDWGLASGIQVLALAESRAALDALRQSRGDYAHVPSVVIAGELEVSDYACERLRAFVANPDNLRNYFKDTLGADTVEDGENQALLEPDSLPYLYVRFPGLARLSLPVDFDEAKDRLQLNQGQRGVWFLTRVPARAE